MTKPEAYLVSITYRRDGTRVVKRLTLQVPLDVATGNLERLSDLQVREGRKDFEAEEERRAQGGAIAPPEPEPAPEPIDEPYDPMSTQLKGPR